MPGIYTNSFHTIGVVGVVGKSDSLFPSTTERVDETNKKPRYSEHTHTHTGEIDVNEMATI